VRESDFQIYSSSETLTDPEYLDILNENWECAAAALEQVLSNTAHQRALIWFRDILTPTLHEGEMASYFGEIVDVGEDMNGKWIDIKLLRHTINNADYDHSCASLSNTLHELLDSGSDALSQRQRHVEARTMNDELQVVLGSLQNLQVPTECTRFYMTMVGPYVDVY
jgi:hypothetical protein